MISTAGCATLLDPETSQEQRADTVLTIGDGQTAGQIFLSRRPGLNNIQLWLTVAAGAADDGRLEARLYRQLRDSTPLDGVAYRLSDLGAANPLEIKLDSPGQRLPAGLYYLELAVTGGAVKLSGRNEDIYPQGFALFNQLPLQADLSFRTGYTYDWQALHGDLSGWLGQSWLLLPLAALLWLPGALLVQLSDRLRRLPVDIRIPLEVGLSMTAIPLAMLWTTTLGLPWSRPAALAAAFGLAASYLAIRILTRRREASPTLTAEPTPDRRGAWLAGLILGVVFLAALGVRLAMVRDLAASAWVDSVHHAVLTRLVLETGGYPQSYAPYVPGPAVGYHAGFHSLMAFFTWLSNLDLPAGMLLFGQVLNAAMLLGVYLLAFSLTNSRAAGLTAALVTGLVTPMPAYYTSWGRYTQLVGLAALPAAFFLASRLLDHARAESAAGLNALLRSIWHQRRFEFFLAASALGGVALLHYRAAAFLGCLLIAHVAVYAIMAIRKPQAGMSLLSQAALLAALGLAAAALTLPWWPDAVSALIAPFGRLAGPAAPFEGFAWSYLDTALGRYAWQVALVGLAISLLLRRAAGFILAAWVGLMLLLANLGALGLPGGALVNTTSVAITLFLPISVLCGLLLGLALDGLVKILPARLDKLPYAAALALGVVLAAFGGRALLPILNPTTLLFRQADRSAIAWVEENIPPGETVLINPLPWGYGLYAGADGGAWIPALAGRPTLPPPVIYGLSPGAGSIPQVNQAVQQVEALADDPVGLHQFLLSQDIHYIFLGARGGILSPTLLRESPLFVERYHSDGVNIFEVRSQS